MLFPVKSCVWRSTTDLGEIPFSVSFFLLCPKPGSFQLAVGEPLGLQPAQLKHLFFFFTQTLGALHWWKPESCVEKEKQDGDRCPCEVCPCMGSAVEGKWLWEGTGQDIGLSTVCVCFYVCLLICAYMHVETESWCWMNSSIQLYLCVCVLGVVCVYICVLWRPEVDLNSALSYFFETESLTDPGA